MKFWKLLHLCLLPLLAMTCLTLTSCGGDDEEDDEFTPTHKVSDDLKKFVGFWNVNHEEFGIFFFEDNKCWVQKKSVTEEYWYLYEWNYSPTTSILAITNNYQWNITLLTDDSWTGLSLGTGNSKSYTAERIGEKNYTSEFTYRIVAGVWVNESDDKDIVSFSYNQAGRFMIYHNNEAVSRFGGGDFEYDQGSDKLKIHYSYSDINSSSSGSFEILHPYNYSQAKMDINASGYGPSIKGKFKRKLSN